MQLKTTTLTPIGMKRDLSDTKFDNRFAFEMKNIRVISRDSNSMLSLENERGTKDINFKTVTQITLENEYVYDESSLTNAIDGRILGVCQMRDYLVLFAKSLTTCYLYKIVPKDTFYAVIKVYENANNDLDFDFEHPIEAIPSYESDSIQKIYWVDGKNQTRFANVSDEFLRLNWSRLNTLNFNFIKASSKVEDISITKLYSGGQFPAGVIQYAFTYFDLNGVETAPFYQSELIPISDKDRSNAADELVANAFSITINNVDNSFDFIRVYAIIRTSFNGTVQARQVRDVFVRDKTNSITFIDDGNNFLDVGETDLLFKGGDFIIPQVITSKDNTLFLGNLEVNQELRNLDFLQITDFETTFELGPEIKLEDVDNAFNTFYTYKPLERRYSHFKKGETYRIAIQAMNKFGMWTEPFYIGDLVCNINYEMKRNSSLKNSTVKLPRISITIRDDAKQALLDHNFITIRPLFVYPEYGDREMLCQGILTSSLLSTDNRNNGNYFSFSDYMIRPRGFTDSLVNINNFEGLPFNSSADFYRLRNSHFTIPVMEISSLDLAETTMPVDSTSVLNTKPDKERVFIDENIVNIYSPELNNSDILKSFITADLELNFVGLSMIANTSSIINVINNDPNSSMQVNKRSLTNNFIDHFNSDTIPDKVFGNPFYPTDLINNSENLFMSRSIRSYSVENILYKTPYKFEINKPTLLYEEDRTVPITTSTYDNSGTVTFKNFQDAVFIHKDVANKVFNTQVKYNTTNNICLSYKDISGISQVTPAFMFETNKSNFKTIVGNITLMRTSSAANLNNYVVSMIFPALPDALIWNTCIGNTVYIKCNIRSKADNSIIQAMNFNIIAPADGNSFIQTYSSVSMNTPLNDLYLSDFEIIGSVEKINLEFFYSNTINFDAQNIQAGSRDILNPDGTLKAKELQLSYNITDCVGFVDDIAITRRLSIQIVDDTGRNYWQTVNLSFNKEINKKGNFTINTGIILPTSYIIIKAPNQWIDQDYTYIDLEGTNKQISYVINTRFYNSSTTESTQELNSTWNGKSNTILVKLPIVDLIYQKPFWRTSGTYKKQTIVINNNINANLKAKDRYLNIVELKKKAFNKYGGSFEDAKLINKFIPCGNKVKLNTNSLKIIADQGDTYLRKYDIMKAYQTSDKTPTSSITSVYLESFINVDGRYDRNRYTIDGSPLTTKNFNLFNNVYNQPNNYFTYFVTDRGILTNTKFPSRVVWSLEKQFNTEVDSWTNISMASFLDVDGSNGPVNYITNFNGDLIYLQDSAIGTIFFNTRTQIPVSDGVPIEITNNYKVTGFKNFSNRLGCLSKWSVAQSKNGLYFLDSLNRTINLFNGQVNDLSVSKNFMTYAMDNITKERFIIKDSISKLGANRMFINNITNEAYVNNKQNSLAFSEILGEFTSLFSYNNVPFMINVSDRFSAFRFNADNNKTFAYELNSGDYNRFFGIKEPSYVTYIVNPNPLNDKIFDSIDFISDGFDESNTYIPNLHFNQLDIENPYQKASKPLVYDRNTFSKKFRTWRAIIPRNENTRDRIRNPFAKLTLSYIPEEDDNYRIILHNLNVNYTEL